MAPLRSAPGFAHILRDAAIVIAGASSIGLIVNAARPSGAIAFVQKTPYDLVVPCPEHVGEAQAMSPDDPRLFDTRSLVIDARSSSDFEVAHVPQAINKPFDWLGPPVGDEVTNLSKRVAASAARAVIVYGDGEDPDSGREWARLLAGGGIKNVYYVTGGAAALASKLTASSKSTSPAGANQ